MTQLIWTMRGIGVRVLEVEYWSFAQLLYQARVKVYILKLINQVIKVHAYLMVHSYTLIR